MRKGKKSDLNSIAFLKNCKLDKIVCSWLFYAVSVMNSSTQLLRKNFKIQEGLPVISQLSVKWPECSIKYVLLEGIFRTLLNICDGLFCENS